MKIAIPTNDRKTVAERSGRAAEFAVIEINEKGVIKSEYLINGHEHTHHADGSADNEDHGHGDMVDLLEGVELIIGKKFGVHFSRDFHNAGVKMIRTKFDSIDDVIESIEF